MARFLEVRDEASFLVLYRRHTPALLLLAQRLLGGSEADAEDAVQEAWVRAMRALDGFRWESSLRTWLCGIIVNCCREQRRRLTGSRQDVESLGVEEERTPDPESTTDVEALVRGLPDGFREVLILHDVEGYTHEEIGRLLGISAGTSKSQLSRARQKLRARLNGRSVAGGEER